MLTEIINHKYREVEKLKQKYPLPALKERIIQLPLPRDFTRALSDQTRVNVIAEIKKASPSHGVFDTPFLQENTVAQIARKYEGNGASAISVLTDHKYFSGSAADLMKTREAVNIPVLRKDFIISDYQIYESRAMGADAVLLIVSCLSDDELLRFYKLTKELGMSALVEVGNKEEVERAGRIGAEIIGINNRNLDTMEVDINRTLEISPAIPAGTIIVSESGIKNEAQIQKLKAEAGVAAVLVGTRLITEGESLLGSLAKQTKE